MNIHCPKCESANAEDAMICGLCGHGLKPEKRKKSTASAVEESEEKSIRNRLAEAQEHYEQSMLDAGLVEGPSDAKPTNQIFCLQSVGVAFMAGGVIGLLGASQQKEPWVALAGLYACWLGLMSLCFAGVWETLESIKERLGGVGWRPSEKKKDLP